VSSELTLRKKATVPDSYRDCRLFGVIAGTPVDTQMGVDCLEARGYHAIGLPASPTPHEQARLQILDKQGLTALVANLAATLKRHGAAGIMIYCNSMSTAVDLERLREEVGIPVITPLDVYRELAGQFNTFGVMAANSQSLAGIEKTLQSSNPDCWQVGYAPLAVVLAIENEEEPDTIVKQYKLKGVLESMASLESEALILGCTHFPYIKVTLQHLNILPIIDPADKMVEMLVGSTDAHR
jgi:glutamate racemase